MWEETTHGVNIRRQEANYHSAPLGPNHARPYHMQKYTHSFPRPLEVYSITTSAPSPESYHLKQVQVWPRLLRCSCARAGQLMMEREETGSIWGRAGQERRTTARGRQRSSLAMHEPERPDSRRGREREAGRTAANSRWVRQVFSHH